LSIGDLNARAHLVQRDFRDWSKPFENSIKFDDSCIDSYKRARRDHSGRNKMMLVRTFVGPSAIEGLGVFAGENIRKGAVVWRLDRNFDRVYSADEFNALPQAVRNNLARYCSWDEARRFWLLCVDDARFFNHADDPNIHDEDLASTAVHDIASGEELTCKYTGWALEHLLGKSTGTDDRR
jgi:SET domain-containing protein